MYAAVTVSPESTQNQLKAPKADPLYTSPRRCTAEVSVPRAKPCANEASSDATPKAVVQRGAGGAWDAISTLTPRTTRENSTTVSGR